MTSRAVSKGSCETYLISIIRQIPILAWAAHKTDSTQHEPIRLVSPPHTLCAWHRHRHDQ